MLVFALYLKIELTSSCRDFLAGFNILASHGNSAICKLLDTFYVLIVASFLPGWKRIIVDLEVEAKILSLSVFIVFVLDLTDNFGNLGNTIIHCSDNLVLTNSLFHFVYSYF
jgi:hypothetical protein